MKNILFFALISLFCTNFLFAQTELTGKSNTLKVRIYEKNIAVRFDSEIPKKVETEKINIKGTIIAQKGLKEILLNNEELAFKPKTGEFTTEMQLKVGKNSFTIIAKDEAGNTAEQKFEIERKWRGGNETGKYYAILIGIDKYTASIPSLSYAISDMRYFKQIIQKYCLFDSIISLENPTKQEINKVFLQLSQKIKQDDDQIAKPNILVYWAGHGYYETINDQERAFYFWTSNSEKNDTTFWFSEGDLYTALSRFDTQHTLVIADACYSGRLVNSRGDNDNPPDFTKPSRKALTSGAMQPVKDKSLFCRFLCEKLAQNNKPTFKISDVLKDLLEIVKKDSKDNQLPQYGNLNLIGNEGGEFIFIKK